MVFVVVVFVIMVIKMELVVVIDRGKWQLLFGGMMLTLTAALMRCLFSARRWENK